MLWEMQEFVAGFIRTGMISCSSTKDMEKMKFIASLAKTTPEEIISAIEECYTVDFEMIDEDKFFEKDYHSFYLARKEHTEGKDDAYNLTVSVSEHSKKCHGPGISEYDDVTLRTKKVSDDVWSLEVDVGEEDSRPGVIPLYEFHLRLKRIAKNKYKQTLLRVVHYR